MLNRNLTLPFQRGKLGGGVAPPPDPFAGSVFSINANKSVVGESVAVNGGSGGTALNATYVGGTTFLPYTGENYFYFNGLDGNSYITVPHSAAIEISGDIEIVTRVALDIWIGSGTFRVIMGKFLDSTSGWTIQIDPSGIMGMYFCLPGFQSVQSTAVLPATPNKTIKWLKYTRNATTGAVNFYYAADAPAEPSSWTQLGTTVSGVAGPLATNTPPLYLNTGGPHATASIGGKFYRGIIRNGIGGTVVFDANIPVNTTPASQISFTCTTGQTATVTRYAGAQYKGCLVVQPMWLFDGVDDVLSVPNNAALNFAGGQSFSFMVVGRTYPSSIGYNQWLAKGVLTNSAPGYEITQYPNPVQQGYSRINGAGGTFDCGDAPAWAAGDLVALTVAVNTSIQRVTLYKNSSPSTPSDITGVGAVTTTDPLIIGGGGQSPAPTPMEIYGAAIYNRVVTPAEITTILTFFK